MRFLLFSLKRSGSTTLLSLLNLHPGIRCMREPFNPANFGGAHHGAVRDAASLDAAVDGLFRTHDGIKHVWERDGWPFSDPALNAQLLLRPGQDVVFLRRRNVLQRVVSNEISRQSGVWTPFTRADRSRVAGFAYAPLDVEAIRRELEEEPRVLDALRERLDAAGTRVHDVDYEALYDPEATPRARRERFEAVLRFLGHEPVGDEAMRARTDTLLDPGQTRLNSGDNYRQIPGIEEVERALGSDRTGWLFR